MYIVIGNIVVDVVYRFKSIISEILSFWNNNKMVILTGAYNGSSDRWLFFYCT